MLNLEKKKHESKRRGQITEEDQERWDGVKERNGCL
jgi:hypothetical protein